jgi:hypothetical protein
MLKRAPSLSGGALLGTASDPKMQSKMTTLITQLKTDCLGGDSNPWKHRTTDAN